MYKALNALGYLTTIGISSATAADVLIRTGWRMDPHPMPHQLAPVLDHPLRLRYRDPLSTVGPYGVEPGMSVLDAGCGTGLFTAELARMVGPEGTVHAVDLQYPFLQATTKRLNKTGLLDRVKLHHCGLNLLPLEDASVDLAVLVAVLGELHRPLVALAEIKRTLKPGGRIAVSEEALDPAYLPAKAVRQYMDEAGFHFGGRSGNAFCYSLIYYNDS